MNFKKANLYSIFLILSGLLFLISSSFSAQITATSKEHENYFPPHSLIGVIVSKDNSSSVAILKYEKTGKIRILKIGERIFDLTLSHVFKNRIILQKDDMTFQIFLGRSNLTSAGKKSKKEPAEISVIDRKEDPLDSGQLNNNLVKMEFDRSEVERRIETEWALIAKETRFIPNVVKGKISGFKITQLPEKSILSEVGINKNDVIKEINGNKLNNMETLFQLYDKFKGGNQFEVTVERNGKLLRLLYTLR